MDYETDARVHLRVPIEEAPYGFRSVEPHHTIFTKPTLLCCGGVKANHNSLDVANGYAKKVLAMVNCLETNGHSGFQTASITYSQSFTLEDTISTFNRGDHRKDMFRNFVEEQLVPLFLDKGNKRLDIDTVKKNFRNINIFAHSFGGIFVQQVGNLLVERMQGAGYSQQEIDSATNQILVVTAGSVANYMKGAAKFKQFDIVHLHDKVSSKHTKNIGAIKALMEETSPRKSLVALKYSFGDNPYDIRPDPNGNEMVITTTNKEPPPEYVLRYDDAKTNDVPRVVDDRETHNCPTYMGFSFDEYGLMLRTIMSAVLSNGLNSSMQNSKNDDPEKFKPLGSHEDLLKLEPYKATYVANIRNPDAEEPEYDLKIVDRLRLDREFLYNNEKDFTKIAGVIGYQERIDEMLGKTPSQSAERQR